MPNRISVIELLDPAEAPGQHFVPVFHEVVADALLLGRERREGLGPFAAGANSRRGGRDFDRGLHDNSSVRWDSHETAVGCGALRSTPAGSNALAVGTRKRPRPIFRMSLAFRQLPATSSSRLSPSSCQRMPTSLIRYRSICAS